MNLLTTIYIYRAETWGNMLKAVVGTTLLLNVFATHLLSFISKDPLFRMRSHAIIAVLFKVIPGVVGIPVRSAAVFILWGLLLDMAFLEADRVYHGDTVNIRMHLTSSAYAVGGFFFAIMSASRLCSMFDAEQELASKKAMMESMVLIMCDASVWLTENGRTVLQADHRFSMIIGRDMTGEDVGSALAEEEQQRLQDCISRAKAAPAVLPTTLLTHSCSEIPVEMFIVGNCDIKAAGKAGFIPAFFIGLRVTSNHNNIEEGSDMRPEHAQAWATALRDNTAQVLPEDRQTSVLSSAPETTSTGRIFDQDNFEHHLAAFGEEGEETEGCRHSLEKVLELGEKEHWIVSAQELEMRADMVLGSGAFGVVVGGWLHGSPIAVKTTKRPADNASASHLVAIANEIRILRHCRHPNLVLFHGACVEPEEGEMMLVLERVKGPDLFRYVTAHAADSDIFKRFQLLLDVACALRYLHAMRPQVVHGDLKGTNVLVEVAVPRAKLVDFGLSRLLTKHPMPLGGTLNWMAPELISKCVRKPKPSADVFSFGRLAYMIIACRKPMGKLRKNVIEDMARRNTMPALVWDEDKPLQKECSELCRKLLNMRPEARITSAQAHEEASAWTLPDLEENMPALKLAQAAKEQPGDAKRPRAASSFRDVLSAALRKLDAPEQSPGPIRPAWASAMEMAGMLPHYGQPQDVDFQREVLARPRLKPTSVAVKTSMLKETLAKWNFSVAGSQCCTYHAAVADLVRLGRGMMQEGCPSDFRPFEFQCSTCGVLIKLASHTCKRCEKKLAREDAFAHIQEEEEKDGAAHSELALRDFRCSL